MNYQVLEKLLNLPLRSLLYKEILNKFHAVKNIQNIRYREFAIEDGTIPVITVNEKAKLDDIEEVYVFIAAQHNEYNGLFGILEFFEGIIEGKVILENYLRKHQILFFFPLMNPYGFLYPNKKNKSGYFLKNGENLNRFWRRTFVPEFKNSESDLNNLRMPEQTKILYSLLEKYWLKNGIKFYFMDFHETSLLERYLMKLSHNFNYTYKFSHWIEERIIINIMELYNISSSPLSRTKCKFSGNFPNINLSKKKVDLINEKLQEYIKENKKKLPFYYSHSKNAHQYCINLAQKVYYNLKSKLWETKFLTDDHKFDNHGCFVKMSDATKRKHVYSMALESKKEFFNIFDEIQKAKRNSYYYDEKLFDIKINIELVYNTITEMIKVFQ
ncbi:MAG: hypothetical protein ACFFD5_15290 [Candidatus Thorarchaeota archaeon]